MADILIAAEQTAPGFWRFDEGDTAELRIAALQPFRNSAGVYVPSGNISNPDTCLVVECVVNADLSVSIPDVTELFTTQDSIDNQNVQYQAALFPRRGGNARQMWPDETTGSGFSIQPNLAPATTWSQICLTNRARYLANPPQTYLNLPDLINFGNGRWGAYRYASDVDAGIAFADVPPVLANHPEFVGTNSPLLPSAGQLAAMLGTQGTPSNTNRYVTDEDFRLPGGEAFVFADRFVSLTAALLYCSSTFSTGATLVISTDISQAGAIVIPPTVNLSFTQAGRLSIVSGTTVIRGGVTAPPQQIFFPSGSGAVSFATAPQSDLLLPEWFGGEAAALVAAATATPTLPVGVVGSNDPRLAATSTAPRYIDPTAAPYSVLRDGTPQSTAGLQAALDAARDSNGLYTGVYCKPGRYGFNSGSLVVPSSIALVGSWEAAPTHSWLHDDPETLFQQDATDGKGTTFEITVGAGTSTGAFITQYANATVKGIAFYYPNQLRTSVAPTVYPPTILFKGETYTAADQRLENCEFVNSYFAVKARYSSRFTIRDIRGCPIYRGLDIDKQYDYALIEDVEFASFIFSAVWDTDPGGANIGHWMNQNGSGLVMARVDHLIVNNLYCYGYERAVYGTTSTDEVLAGLTIPGGAPWATFINAGADGCRLLAYLEDAAGSATHPGVGVIFNGGMVTGNLDPANLSLDGYGISTGTAFKGQLQVTGMLFGGGAGVARDYNLHLQGGGQINVAGCFFHTWDHAAIIAAPMDVSNPLNLTVTGNTFYGATGAAIQSAGPAYMVGLSSGNQYINRTHTEAFNLSQQAGYEFHSNGDKFADNVSLIGNVAEINAGTGGFVVLDNGNLAGFGNVSAASSSGQGSAGMAGITTGSDGFAVFSVNVSFDRDTGFYNRLSVSNEAWQILQEAKADNSGRTVFRHADAGANPIVWTDVFVLSPTGAATFSGQYASAEVDAGNSGTAKTIDWNAGNVQYVTLTGDCTFTFSNPIAGARYCLMLKQDATGSRLATWPAAVLWSAGTAPTLTTTAAKVDIITFIFDGVNTKYYGGSVLNF
jgi:hypothetical protein